ncbi:MAG: nickel pincer cofactor biosynthesis protein LarB [Actinobacteria bacterium]|nr:nickel pincer cofactor biosynthesis protein LarB [Actinomycetota bacterium]
MNPEELRGLLRAVADGQLSPDDAVRRLRYQPFDDLGFAKVDTQRPLRTGYPEIIFCGHKTPDQVAAIAQRIAAGGSPVLATKASPVVYAAVRAVLPSAAYHPTPQMITVAAASPLPVRGHVTVVAAGTSDLPVSEEAAITATMLGTHVTRVADVGVAGLHRLMAHRPALDAADAIVVVAGMEGALPSVVGGLVDRPIIAVPTSVGYGASFHGLAALLGMLNACAPGISVVNIDNGFGGGYQAALIARRAQAPTP